MFLFALFIVFRIFSPNVVPTLSAVLPRLHASDLSGRPTSWFTRGGKRHNGGFWKCQPWPMCNHRQVRVVIPEYTYECILALSFINRNRHSIICKALKQFSCKWHKSYSINWKSRIDCKLLSRDIWASFSGFCVSNKSVCGFTEDTLYTMSFFFCFKLMKKGGLMLRKHCLFLIKRQKWAVRFSFLLPITN